MKNEHLFFASRECATVAKLCSRMGGPGKTKEGKRGERDSSSEVEVFGAAVPAPLHAAHSTAAYSCARHLHTMDRWFIPPAFVALLRTHQRFMSDARRSESPTQRRGEQLAPASAESMNELSYVQRVVIAATTWRETLDVENLLCEVRAAPVALILSASLASSGVIVFQFLKTRTTGQLLDMISRGKTVGDVSAAPWVHLIGLLVLFGCCEICCGIAKDYLFSQARAARVVRARVAYFSSMLGQELAFHDKHRSAELAHRLSVDPEAMDDAVLYSLDRALQGIGALLCGLYIGLTDWPTLVLGLLLRLPYVLQFVEVSLQISAAYDRLRTDSFAGAQARASEALGHVRTLQANTAEAGEIAGYEALLARNAEITASGAAVSSLIRHAEKTVEMGSEILLLAWGAFRIVTGRTTLGTFTANRGHMDMVVQKFNQLEAMYVGLRQAALRSRRYVALRDRKPAICSVAPAAAAAAPHSPAATATDALADDNVSGDHSDQQLLQLSDGIRRRHGLTSSLAVTAACGVATSESSDDNYCKDDIVVPKRFTLSFENVSFSYPRNDEGDESYTASSNEDSQLMEGPPASPSTPAAAVAAVILTEAAVLSPSPSASPFDPRSPLVTPAVVAEGAPTTVYAPSASATVAKAFIFPDASQAQLVHRRALSCVSFCVRPDRVVGIVGASGSGKSTIARLCLRFFDPSEGVLRVNEEDIRSIPLQKLRRTVALVDQDSSLLDRSIADNLLLGISDSSSSVGGRSSGAIYSEHHSAAAVVPGLEPAGRRWRCRDPATEAAMIDAARAANIHDFIMSLPQQYDTMVGERGGRLSGGQKQRMQIARAVLRDPGILVLDEATSALDSENEALVSAALSALMRGRATIIIAHRLHTVRHADEILVMEGGRVVERGTHCGILEQFPRGTYANLLSHHAKAHA